MSGTDTVSGSAADTSAVSAELSSASGVSSAAAVGADALWVLSFAVEAEDALLFPPQAARHTTMPAASSSANNPGGTVTVHAGAVVLATGGFSGNDEKLRDSVAHPREGNKGMTYADYRAEIDFELKGHGPAYCADTLEGLAEKLGMEPSVLTASVGAYNESLGKPKMPMMPFEPQNEEDAGNPSFHNDDVDHGEDGPGLPPPPPAEPITDGPFYAFLGQRFAEGAFGGVMTNEDVEVIREDGSVIPGLYAVGDAASTWYTRGVLGPLTELTWAVNSGYFAADSAKNYLS